MAVREVTNTVTQLNGCHNLWDGTLMDLHGAYPYPLLTDFKVISTFLMITQHKANSIYVAARPVL